MKYYESLFPWLTDYLGENVDDLLSSKNDDIKTDIEKYDPVQSYMTDIEYTKLSPTKRNQIALNRYWSSKKTSWQIGRDYERYIGFLYEMRGYKVQYYGIEKGYEDLGRDLVCIKNGSIEIIQCKYWSKSKNIPIRENHINQLFGTTVKHFIDLSSQNKLENFLLEYRKKTIKASLITSVFLSETAKKFATSLGINFIENLDFDFNYPSIKCNINLSTKEKIYHLPFDLSYDKVQIDLERGECYVKTIEEAENLGFRRSYKWLGSSN